MAKSPDKVLECLAFAVQNGRKIVAERLLGKYRKIRNLIENQNLQDQFYDPVDPLS